MADSPAQQPGLLFANSPDVSQPVRLPPPWRIMGRMLRAAILDDYQGVALSMTDWSPLDGRVQVDVFREHIVQEDDIVAALQPYDIVVAMRERTAFPRTTLDRLPNLKLLITTGMGNAAVDVRACYDHGVTFSGTGGGGTSTAELTWALILAAARGIVTEVNNVRGGGWMTTVGTDLQGQTLGLLGLGRLGGRVATIGRAFGMELIAWSQNLTADRCAEMGVTLVERDELFRRADFLSVHLVLSERTRGLVSERDLRQMKQTAWLVNTSRGPIVDEAALAAACEEGWIAGAALDAYSVEPLPAGHPFRRLNNVLPSPHVGYVTESTYRTWFAHIVEDIAGFVDGKPLRIIPRPS